MFQTWHPSTIPAFFILNLNSRFLLEGCMHPNDIPGFFLNFLVRGSFSSQQHPKFSQFCGTCSQIQIFCLKLCASQQHPRASLFWDLFVRASSASQRHPKTIPASQIQSKRFSKSDVRGCACHPSNLVLGMMHPSEGPFHPK